MLEIITKKSQVEKVQKKFRDKLFNTLIKRKAGRYTIGFKGDNIQNVPIYSNDKIWYFGGILDKGPAIPRYWNPFGVSKYLKLNTSNSITVEINIPEQNVNRRIGGFFALNRNNNHILLFHRGNVGGGRKGIGKNAFLSWYKNNALEKKTYASYFSQEQHTDDIVFVADLSSNEFIKQISSFVLQVADFKNEVTNKNIASLTDDKLIQRIKILKNPKKHRIETTLIDRDPYIAELVKRKANGKCQLCKKDAPFLDRNGRPFLECHHIIPLSEGGKDDLVNAVAVCPNCHRKIHNLNKSSDVKRLKRIAQKYAII